MKTYHLNSENPYQVFYTQSYSNISVLNEHKKHVIYIRSKLRFIKFSHKNRILDIACGISTLGKTFGKNVYGIDVNPEAVKVAKKNEIKAIVGDIEKPWNYPDKFFDIVIASHIIEHVVNPDHIIRESKRVLKDDGFLIIATPNLAAWFNRILLLCGIQPFFSEVSTEDKTLGLMFTRKLTVSRRALGHLRLFTLGALKDILSFHGFITCRVTAAEFPSFPPTIRVIDKIFSFFPSLASNIIVVCRKSSLNAKNT